MSLLKKAYLHRARLHCMRLTRSQIADGLRDELLVRHQEAQLHQHLPLLWTKRLVQLGGCQNGLPKTGTCVLAVFPV